MRCTVIAIALVAACGGGGGSAREADTRHVWHEETHGPLPQPEPAPEPEPIPLLEPVELPPASFRDDLVAPASASAESMQAYDDGVLAYDRGELEAAEDGFIRAYEHDPHVEYLFDIAQANRLLGDAKRALFFYKRYHHMATREGSSFIDVQPVIDDLQAIVEAQER